MAAVPVSQLSQEEKDELVCTYASMILYDAEADISAEAIANLVKVSGNSVEAYWPALYSKLLNGKDVSKMLSVGGGGGGAPAGGAAAGGEAAAGGAEGGAKKEEVVEEEEDDMEFDLFD